MIVEKFTLWNILTDILTSTTSTVQERLLYQQYKFIVSTYLVQLILGVSMCKTLKGQSITNMF